eukprot:5621623-Karenia_brevis.AAC.1
MIICKDVAWSRSSIAYFTIHPTWQQNRALIERVHLAFTAPCKMQNLTQIALSHVSHHTVLGLAKD